MIDERALTSAPASISIRIASDVTSAAAHINGVWPRQFSIVSTTPPLVSRMRTASAFPFRAHRGRAVSPSGPWCWR